MEKIYNKKSQCTGCTACLNICPKKAISMKEDEEGFLYPHIDSKLCINCGACQKICHMRGNNSNELKRCNMKSYAVKNKNDDVLKNSSSGGAFTAISNYIFENGGYVYGVVLNKNMEVIHTVAKNPEERDKMRGSKYVQSDMLDIFNQVKDNLKKQDKLVVFVGTPCQVAGLKKYLGKLADAENLILCDMVCHGATSPMIWREHIKFIEKNAKKKIKDYKFRDKVNGWGNHTESILYEDNKYDSKSAISQSYRYLYHAAKLYRPSCYECKYTDTSRTSDITIADFWGLKKSFPDFYDKRGVSLVLITTEKGEKLFDKIKESVIYKECNLEDCMQPQLQRPTSKPVDRDEIWKDYNSKGYEYILNKYTCYGGKERVKFEIKRMIPVKLKVGLKKVLGRE